MELFDTSSFGIFPVMPVMDFLKLDKIKHLHQNPYDRSVLEEPKIL